MYQVFVILAVIVALLLIFVVLIQESKGGGLASNFSASNAIMGVRKTTDFIEKSTWILAIVLVILTVFSYYAIPQENSTNAVVDNMKVTAPVTTPKAPSAPAAPTQQPAQ